MKFIMRLYRRHDMDLLLLHKTKGFSMQKAVKVALYMHLGLIDEGSIPYPAVGEPLDKFFSSSQLHLTLSEDNDMDMAVIKFIKDIPKGYRNSYCKNIVRYYLERPKQFMYSNNKIFFGKGENK
jgi:hypothetical protein